MLSTMTMMDSLMSSHLIEFHRVNELQEERTALAQNTTKLGNLSTLCVQQTFDRAAIEEIPQKKRNELANTQLNAGFTSEIELSLLHRVIRAKNVWYVPQANRELAIKLLRFAQIGNFVVRRSSRPGCMAMTVHAGNNFDHYVVEITADGSVRLEGSQTRCATLELLICHYCEQQTDMSYRLYLPRPIMEAKNDLQLLQYDLIGKEIWRALKKEEASSFSCGSILEQKVDKSSCDRLSMSLDELSLSSSCQSLLSSTISPIESMTSTLSTGWRCVNMASRRSPQVEVMFEPIVNPDASSFSSVDRDEAVEHFNSPSGTVSRVRVTSSSSRPAVDKKVTTIIPPTSPGHYDAIWAAKSAMASNVKSSSSIDDSASVIFSRRHQPLRHMHQLPPIPSKLSKDKGVLHHHHQQQQQLLAARALILSPGEARRSSRTKASAITDLNHPSEELTPAGTALETLETALRDLQEDLRSVLISVSSMKPSSPKLMTEKKLDVEKQVHLTTKHQDEKEDVVAATFSATPEYEDEDIISKFVPLQRESAREVEVVSAHLHVQSRHEASPLQCKFLVDSDRPGSDYDNVRLSSLNGVVERQRQRVNSGSSSGTVFSKPWDSSLWGQLLQPGLTDSFVLDQLSDLKPPPSSSIVIKTDSEVRMAPVPALPFTKEPSIETDPPHDEVEAPLSTVLNMMQHKSSSEELVIPEVSSSTLLNNAASSQICQPSIRRNKELGRAIQNFIISLAHNEKSSFSQQITSFIECTKCSKRAPRDMLRNIRQFISGMKNYLIRHGEDGLQAIIDAERNMLEKHEFLNIDIILESVLHKIIVKPLKSSINSNLVDFHRQNGSLALVALGVAVIGSIPPEMIGLQVPLLGSSDLRHVERSLLRMETASSPTKKLRCFLSVVGHVYASISHLRKETPIEDKELLHHHINADDFLPALVWTLAACRLTTAEIEADYMECLLQPSALSGDAAYYITTLQASVEILKSLSKHSPHCLYEMSKLTHETDEPKLSSLTSTASELRTQCARSTIRILVLDERHDALQSHVFPIRTTSCASDLSAIIAHRLCVQNPAQCSLYLLQRGATEPERRLGAEERPYELRNNDVHPCLFLYRRDTACVSLPPGYT